MRRGLLVVVALSLTALLTSGAWAHSGATLEWPKLLFKPTIDGDPSEWEDFAFTDGTWDLARQQGSPQFQAGIMLLDAVNAATGESNEPEGTPLTSDDLSAEYFLAWDDEGMYGAVRTRDNVHDVRNEANNPTQWYFKDSINWYLDIPHDGDGEGQAQGDHIWSFVADPSKPADGVWWRHGEGVQLDIEVPPPPDYVLYNVILTGGPYGADYTIETFVPWQLMIAFTPAFAPVEGALFGFCIVHPDADGTTAAGGDIQDWGGQFVIYTTGSGDQFWGDVTLVGPTEGQPVAVETPNWEEVKRLFR